MSANGSQTRRESKGNGAVLLLVDTSDVDAHARVEPAMVSALAHLGFPYRTWDLATGCPANSDYANCACAILGQDHLGKSIGSAAAETLAEAVAAGMGLVSFDGDLGSHRGGLLTAFDMRVSEAPVRCSSIKTVNTTHYIVGTRELDDDIALDAAVEVWPVESGRYGTSESAPLQTASGWPLVIAARHGRGRAVFFTASMALWTFEVLGHACGLDDVFWKAIVWAARKPFVVYGMPPFATALVDDCSGSYNHFRYVDTMNRYGWLPHLEVYLEDIDRVMHDENHLDSKKIKALYDEGLADFGVHGFAYDELMWFDHRNRRPLSDERLAENFERYDSYLERWGITPSRMENCHFGEIGRNALPFLKDRGIEYLAMPLPFDTAWFDVPDKVAPLRPPGPYHHQGFNMGELPEDPHFFTLRAKLDAKNRASTAFVPQVDFLWNHTMFWDECPRTDVEAAARTAVLQVRRGIDARFFGQTVTHEQRVGMVNMGEWEEIYALLQEGLRKYDLIFRPTEYVCDYVRSHYHTHPRSIAVDEQSGRIACTLEGEARVVTALEVYTDEGEGVACRVHDVPSFAGSVSVKT
jgi:hypothetical protein